MVKQHLPIRWFCQDKNDPIHFQGYKNAKVQDFHIVGHSLGAHIGGYAGEKLISLNQGKLGRITALDPAQPLFQDMPEFVRLDPGDADFVDVIHTDAKSILMGGLLLYCTKCTVGKNLYTNIFVFSEELSISRF